jgi:hypothetical protein
MASTAKEKWYQSLRINRSGRWTTRHCSQCACDGGLWQQLNQRRLQKHERTSTLPRHMPIQKNKSVNKGCLIQKLSRHSYMQIAQANVFVETLKDNLKDGHDNQLCKTCFAENCAE